MTLSDLQQIICDKETELAQMRKAAIDAAQHQALEMMKLEMEHAHQENELTMREAIHASRVKPWPALRAQSKRWNIMFNSEKPRCLKLQA